MVYTKKENNMSKIQINKLTNANVYMDGVNLLGRAEEVQLPQIKHKMAEHKALGMVASAEFFSGIDKLECKIKWNSFYPEVLIAAANPFTSVLLQVRASLETYNGAGRIEEVPVSAIIIGTFKDFQPDAFKPHENTNVETNIAVTCTKLIINKVPVLEIDVLQNIYKINSIDMLAKFKKNIGG